MNFEVRYTHHPHDYKHYDTARLRQEFLIETLMQQNAVSMVYSHYDRLVIGSAVPIEGALRLEAHPMMAVDYFLEKREIGIINLGGKGTVTTDQGEYPLGFKDALYLGKGEQKVIFSSADAQQPARFYFNSAAAHRKCPAKKIPIADSPFIELGTQEESNLRKLYQQVTYLTVETCQLMMGITEPVAGAAWNTMPSHIHELRMEAYFYFGMPENKQVCHIMGTQEETRNVWASNEQAVISPPWSMHCAAGTSPYAFVWGMAGDDSPIEPININHLR